jgi:hypothetical protein
MKWSFLNGIILKIFRQQIALKYPIIKGCRVNIFRGCPNWEWKLFTEIRVLQRKLWIESQRQKFKWTKLIIIDIRFKCLGNKFQ